jgi:hypothetical protein
MSFWPISVKPYFKENLNITYKIKKRVRSVGFEVLAAVGMKNYTLWDITLRSPLKFDRRFEGTYHLHLHDQRVRQARNKHGAGSNQKMETTTTCSSEMSIDFQRTYLLPSFLPSPRRYSSGWALASRRICLHSSLFFIFPPHTSIRGWLSGFWTI